MFNKSLEIGKEGEIKVINQLKSKGFEVYDYTDYNLFKYKQQKGYDIEVKNPTTQELDRVDIKSNAKKGYIYLEVKQYDNLGWFWTSSSDLIYHYDLKQDEIYGYELKKMRNFVHKNDIKPNHGRQKNLIGLKVVDNNLIQKI